jgi:hypothetical protein
MGQVALEYLTLTILDGLVDYQGRDGLVIHMHLPVLLPFCFGGFF